MYEKIPLAGVDTEGWLCLRKSGIGGSDAGAICGVNPYSSAMKVFQDSAETQKRGLRLLPKNRKRCLTSYRRAGCIRFITP